MRKMLLLAALLAAPAYADYSEKRDLVLDAAGLSAVDIDAGAGKLEVTGSSSVNSIVVEAKIVVEGMNDSKGSEWAEKRVRLSLDRSGETAVLVAQVDNGGWGSMWRDARIDLEIQVPDRLNLNIDDNSGRLTVTDVLGHVAIDDGSGSIDIRNVGSVYIDDGSGGIDVNTVAGDVEVDDGSGGIDIAGVGGSVTISDGSGGIRVADVAQDLIVPSDGSGGVDYRNIGGTVTIDD